MQLHDAGGQVASRPAPIATNSPGYAANAGPPTAPTTADPDCINAIMAELLELLTLTGQAPSKADVTQVSKALLMQFGVFGNDTGTANAYLVPSPLALPSLRDGQRVTFVTTHPNTGASTVEVTWSGGNLPATSILRGDGSPLQPGDIIAGRNEVIYSAGSSAFLINGTPQLAHGQCQLTNASGTQLQLLPKDGNGVVVQGQQCRLPAGGVTLSNSGLAQGSLYYIYLTNSGGTPALVASATGHVTDSGAGNVGVEVMSGDSSKSLVGMAYIQSSGPSAGQFGSLCTASWFHRRSSSYGSTNLTPSTGSTSLTLLSGTGTDFVTWGDEGVRIAVIGSASVNASGVNCTTSAGIDGASGGAQTSFVSSGSGAAQPVAPEINGFLTEGHHVASAFGSVASNTGSWSFGLEIDSRV